MKISSRYYTPTSGIELSSGSSLDSYFIAEFKRMSSGDAISVYNISTFVTTIASCSTGSYSMGKITAIKFTTVVTTECPINESVQLPEVNSSSTKKNSGMRGVTPIVGYNDSTEIAVPSIKSLGLVSTKSTTEKESIIVKGAESTVAHTDSIEAVMPPSEALKLGTAKSTITGVDNSNLNILKTDASGAVISRSTFSGLVSNSNFLTGSSISYSLAVYDAGGNFATVSWCLCDLVILFF